MPISTPFVGTGKFIPVREWSCPVHDDDPFIYDEYDPWNTEGEVCLDCEMGRWRDKTDADGNVVMSEMGYWEVALVTHAQSFFDEPPPVEMLRDGSSETKIQWLEDEFLPRIDAA